MDKKTASQGAKRQEMTILVLQGGGALGAYQAGAFEALAEAGWMPDWIAGVSIGAINASIIAGSKPEDRAKHLRLFWNTVSEYLQNKPAIPGEVARRWFNEANAAAAATFGVPGFFSPRFPSPLLSPPGSLEALSFFDTSPLRATLTSLVDFDLLNSGAMRLSLGAVNIRSGNSVYFDTKEQKISVDHVMASGALPPGFPPVLIDGEAYWDGGLVSNTPIQYVLDDSTPPRDMVVFQ